MQMQALDDIALLREYAERHSEEAFATLVTRHINKVYSVAFRHTGNPHSAEEITQAVFVILATKAGRLRKHTLLSGWLYQTARFTALTFIRNEIRRGRAEQEAHVKDISNELAPDVWPQIAPLLDAAMGHLSDADRHAVVLRFFDGKSMNEVGAAMGSTEDAAKKRVHRAVEKLQKFFFKRGVNSSATAITESISAHSVQAAPVLLAKTVTAVALSKGAAASTSILTLTKGALKLMAWTKTKITIVAAAAVLLTAGTTTLTIGAIHWLKPKPDIRGAWEGVIDGNYTGTSNVKLRLVLNLDRIGNSYRANLDSIDQRVKAIPVANFSYDYPAINFEVPTVNGTFKGKFISTNEMSGIWKQVGFSTPLKMSHTASPDAVPDLLDATDYKPRTGSDLQGYWKGTLKVGRTALQLVFKVSESEDGKYIAEMDSLDQNVSSLIVSSVTYNKPDVTLEVGVLGGEFSGTLSGDDQQIVGTWTQNGSSFPLTVQRSDPAVEREAAAAKEVGKDYSYSSPNDLTGHWHGTLELQGMKLRLALHVAKMPDGTLSATLDSLDQGANGIPATTVRFTAPDAHLEWQSIAGTYDCKVQNDKLVGSWQQLGKPIPLNFDRGATP